MDERIDEGRAPVGGRRSPSHGQLADLGVAAGPIVAWRVDRGGRVVTPFVLVGRKAWWSWPAPRGRDGGWEKTLMATPAGGNTRTERLDARPRPWTWLLHSGSGPEGSPTARRRELIGRRVTRRMVRNGVNP